MKRIFALIIASGITLTSQAYACEPHWITGIYDAGEVIQLEDQSLWKTMDICLKEASSWEVGDNVEVCDDKKIRNVDKAPEEQQWVFVKMMTPYRQTEKPQDCDPGK